MPVTEEIEKLAVARAPASDIHEVAQAQGMFDLRIDGLLKAANGQTSISEVLRVAI